MNTLKLFVWRPTTTILLLAGFFVLLVASVISYSIANLRPTGEVEARLASGVYSLRVADTDTERENGLAGVKRLKPNEGLLIKFDEDEKWGIWMKGMKIPIDIIWLNSKKEVVYVVKNAPPELSDKKAFYPNSKSRYVIELPAGSSDKAGIKPGVVATFDEYAQEQQ